MASRNLRCFSRLLTNYTYQYVPTPFENRYTYYITNNRLNNCNCHHNYHLRNFCLEVKRNDVLASVQNSAYSVKLNMQQKQHNRTFIEYENLFAYDILKEMDEYRHFEDLSSKNPGDKSLIQYEKYYWHLHRNKAIDELLRKIDRYDNEMVIKLLRSLVSTIPYVENEDALEQLYYNGNFLLIWKKLEAHCMNQLRHSISSTFADSRDFLPYIMMANLWFELGMNRSIKTFIGVLMDKLVEYDRPLCKYTFLQLMFFINLQRTIPKKMEPKIFAMTEAFLMQNNNEGNGGINLKDLTLVAMGFFKTQTRMNPRLVELFLQHCQRNFDKKHEQNYTMSVTSILKSLRYSMDSLEFDYRSLRSQVKKMVDSILQNPEYVNSPIVLTHLILLLNRSYLHDMKPVYKLVSDKMIDNLAEMRIKDIERVLFCFSNANFELPFWKLKQLDQYVASMADAKNFPNFLYNICFYLRVMGFVGTGVERLILQPEIFQKTMETTNENSYEIIMAVDTAMRLMPRNAHTNTPQRLLTEPQIHSMMDRLVNVTNIQDTKQTRFLGHIKAILEPKFGKYLQFIQLFPHIVYPYPVILTGRSLRVVDNWRNYQQELKTERRMVPGVRHYLGDNVIPYDEKFMKANFFNGCKVLQIILIRDYLFGAYLRGASKFNIQLLEVLGFKIHLLHQSEYHSFILPSHLFDRNPEEYESCVQRLLDLTGDFSHMQMSP